jgi:hypothetical protein
VGFTHLIIISTTIVFGGIRLSEWANGKLEPSINIFQNKEMNNRELKLIDLNITLTPHFINENLSHPSRKIVFFPVFED